MSSNTAPIKYAQRKDSLYLTIALPDVKDETITLTDTGLDFKGKSQDKDYSVSIEFMKAVDAEGSTYKVLPRSVQMHILKKDKEEDEFWPRLLKDKALEKNQVKIDWDRYVDEDEEEGGFDMSNLEGGMGMGGMPGMGGGMGGMPGMGGMEGMMGGMGGMPGMEGMGGMLGMEGMDMAKLMEQMGQMGGAEGMGGMGGMGGDDDDDDDDDEEDDDDDAKLARKLSREQSAANGERRSSRLAKDAGASTEAVEGTAERERRQIKLMERRNEERLREIARENMKSRGRKDEEDLAEELETYKNTKEYPPNVQPNQVKVDMASQCVLLPVFGNPVPFHISTIKNVVLPDPDNATLLRINFYTAGMAVGKDAPANMAKLVQKYAPYASFIREMTFRSLDGHNLVQAFRQISELRKRARAREIREMEEATLVAQEKLIRTKNERVPRLSDLTMRPVFAGKKTQGNLEAHSNGLRFISTRSEVVDIMYNNIKYAIFQPCENEIMVLVHFHLKNPIMIGKKKHMDVQFFTEVVDASQAVDNGRRSMYDPDEMDDEQRERQLRKRLNQAFKDFCKKVDAVAKKNKYHLEFDIPYRDLGFTGTPSKEMVTVLPTLNCLVNLTETPFFVVDLDYVDHVHFERVTYMSKAFDMILINKDFNKMPWRIDMIPNGDKESIQEWLTDMEITYTEGPMNLNWKSILATAKEDDRFYMNTMEDEVTEKEAGWEILRMYGKDDEEEDDDDEDDSEFGEESVADEEEEEVDDDDEIDEEAFDSEEDDDFDADEELEEQGMDWDEMEMQAAQDDKRKRRMDAVQQDEPPPRTKSRGGGGGGGSKRRRR